MVSIREVTISIEEDANFERLKKHTVLLKYNIYENKFIINNNISLKHIIILFYSLTHTTRIKN